MSEDLQPGDTVQLKSGGPLMTLDHIGPAHQGSDRNQALCSWFVSVKGKQERKSDWFELHSLRKVDTEAESYFVPSNPLMR